MPNYVFPGYPAFLEAAAAELGRPESVDPARRIGPLSSMGHLLAQAAHADPSDVGVILARAAEFRDQLATALRAAELMLADVKAGRAPSPPGVEPEPGAQSPGPGPPRKGPRTPRDPS